MAYYHVRITRKSNPSQAEVELDMSLEKLKERFVQPYDRGQPIVIDGRSISSEDIEQIKINETKQASAELRAAVQYNRTARLFATTRGTNLHIATTGRDVTDEFITRPPGHGVQEGTAATLHPPSTTPMRVFISHRNTDVEVAKPLVELLRKALNLKSDEIRCTSLDGYRMQGGVLVDKNLRKEVFQAQLLIGLITPSSLQSAYVMFELGARWGAEKPMIPLLASGATPKHLEGPLAGINALDSHYDSQVYQFVEDAANYLQVNLDKPSSYAVAVRELVEASSKSQPIDEQQTTIADPPQLSEDARTLLVAATKDKQGSIRKISSTEGTVLRVGIPYFGKSGNPRLNAKWNQAFQDLPDLELVEDLSGIGDLFEVTQKGFQVVDNLPKSE